MASLNWQSTSPKSSPTPAISSGSSPVNPWFAISMSLVGLIAGWTIGNSSLVSGSSPTPAPVAQAPTAAIQPPAQAEQPPPPPTVSFENVPAVDLAKDHVRGNPNAEVVVVQYSDYECPFSKRVQATYQQIADTYGDKVAVVFRHFPLGFHPNAEPAAVASECAAELGGNDAFWAFNDKVFETQGEWSYEKYAGELGLDVGKFKDCIGSSKYTQLVQDQLSGGSKAGVNGTPSNFVMNLKKKTVVQVSGAQPFANFQSAIDGAF